MSPKIDARTLWLAGGLLVAAAGWSNAQAPAAQPAGDQAEAPAAAMVLSPGALGGSQLYQSWPLILTVAVWREAPAEEGAAPPPITIKAEQGAWCEALVVTVKDAADRLKDPAVRQQLVAQSMRWTAIHEMGHACSLLGHYEKGDPEFTEVPIGNSTCPMRYSDRAQDLQYAVLQVLLKPDAAMPMTYGQFCRDADFNCWGHLNVKDN